MRWVVTGHKGFIGSAICDELCRDGHEVFGISRSPSSGRSLTAEAVRDLAAESIADLLRDWSPDAILHAAGPADVRGSFQDADKDFRASLLTWRNVLESTKSAGIKPVIGLTSSAAVYGQPKALPISEDAPRHPLSPYGFHKQCCEIFAVQYAELHGMEIEIYRIFSVFGPAMRRLLVWEVYQQAMQNRSIHLAGTGRELRDYLLIDDAARAMLQLMSTRRAERRAGARAVNIARGESRTVGSIASMISRQLLDSDTVSAAGQNVEGNPTDWCADTKLLRELAPDWKAGDFEAQLRACVMEWAGGNF